MNFGLNGKDSDPDGIFLEDEEEDSDYAIPDEEEYNPDSSNSKEPKTYGSSIKFIDHLDVGIPKKPETYIVPNKTEKSVLPDEKEEEPDLLWRPKNGRP